jgi:4-oxalocrotonate tautomerase
VPLVNVKVVEGVFSPEQKQDMIRRLTDAMVEIEGESMRPVTWVLIEEVQSGDWGIAGNPMSTAPGEARMRFPGLARRGERETLCL